MTALLQALTPNLTAERTKQQLEEDFSLQLATAVTATECRTQIRALPEIAKFKSLCQRYGQRLFQNFHLLPEEEAVAKTRFLLSVLPEASWQCAYQAFARQSILSGATQKLRLLRSLNQQVPKCQQVFQATILDICKNFAALLKTLENLGECLQFFKDSNCWPQALVVSSGFQTLLTDCLRRQQFGHFTQLLGWQLAHTQLSRSDVQQCVTEACRTHVRKTAQPDNCCQFFRSIAEAAMLTDEEHTELFGLVRDAAFSVGAFQLFWLSCEHLKQQPASQLASQLERLSKSQQLRLVQELSRAPSESAWQLLQSIFTNLDSAVQQAILGRKTSTPQLKLPPTGLSSRKRLSAILETNRRYSQPEEISSEGIAAFQKTLQTVCVVKNPLVYCFLFEKQLEHLPEEAKQKLIRSAVQSQLSTQNSKLFLCFQERFEASRNTICSAAIKYFRSQTLLPAGLESAFCGFYEKFTDEATAGIAFQHAVRLLRATQAEDRLEKLDDLYRLAGQNRQCTGKSADFLCQNLLNSALNAENVSSVQWLLEKSVFRLQADCTLALLENSSTIRSPKLIEYLNTAVFFEDQERLHDTRDRLRRAVRSTDVKDRFRETRYAAVQLGIPKDDWKSLADSKVFQASIAAGFPIEALAELYQQQQSTDKARKRTARL